MTHERRRTSLPREDHASIHLRDQEPAEHDPHTTRGCESGFGRFDRSEPPHPRSTYSTGSTRCWVTVTRVPRWPRNCESMSTGWI